MDYSHGHTGSAHDSIAFESTAAAKCPDWLFEGQEFAWGDSAYPLSPCMIPVHKKPAALRRENAIFDRAVANIRVHSEHCMGALKGQFQCLHGLHVDIKSNKDHVEACRWITIAIILHNMVIDVDGTTAALNFGHLHLHAQEVEDRGMSPEITNTGDMEEAGEAKHNQLVAEIVVYKSM